MGHLEARPMRYWAIDTEIEGINLGTKSVFGPFPTRKDADAFICRDFKSWWQESEVPLCDRDAQAFGAWIILEEKAVVRPVGIHQVKVQLVEASK
jgi:hypothetical protein